MGCKIKNILCILLALGLAVSVLPAGANLVPTTFGFPVIVQNGSTSAFNQDTATATDLENLNVQVPAYADGLNLGGTAINTGLGIGVGGGTGVGTDGTGIGIGNGGTGVGVGLKATANALPFGPVDLAFPDVSQTSDETQSVTHTDFAQTNEYAEFAYPFVGVGGVSLPGFGFGF